MSCGYAVIRKPFQGEHVCCNNSCSNQSIEKILSDSFYIDIARWEPQGAYLGGIILIVKYNGAFLRPPVPRLIKGPVNKSKADKVKFVDDGTVAVIIDLKQSLIPDPEDTTKPLNFFERTGHIHPPEHNLIVKSPSLCLSFFLSFFLSFL